MEIKKYWWEDAVIEEIVALNQDDYRSSAEMILLIQKIIEAEKNGKTTKK